jgi:hypothetical protein
VHSLAPARDAGRRYPVSYRGRIGASTLLTPQRSGADSHRNLAGKKGRRLEGGEPEGIKPENAPAGRDVPSMVEIGGFEPPTSAMRTQRSPN